MFTATSTTVTEADLYEAKGNVTWEFSMDNGSTGIITVSDPLLDTEAAATERAKSEFLKNGYKHRDISFSTHRDDLVLNDVIIVKGLPYLVKSIDAADNSVSTLFKIKAKRYEL